MRILFLGNNWLACGVLRWLKERREEIAGVVLHPPERRRNGDELVGLAGTLPTFDGSRLREPALLDSIRALNCDIAVSVLFGYILQPDFLALPPLGCINLHPSLLPYNRGAHPNVWSIIEGTPAGATLHYMDAGVDTGDIIAQRQVSVEPTDTGATLYRKLEVASLELFCETWPAVAAGKATRLPQDPAAGTRHRACELEGIDEIDLDSVCKAADLINLLRARTFLGYRGAYFRAAGRKVYVSLQLTYGDEAES
ncbi:MAG TPA: formyltransferase family protein [Candidatus Binatia bacterium]|nr:formyltransferase family protein [Candidatus Binatia bacterium]